MAPRDKDLSVERGIINVDSAVEHLNKLYEDDEYRKSVAEECYEVTQNPAFRWDQIALGFEKAMEDLVK